jgi:CDP-diacylglycerol--glycerol-3-phosphate 3-phosphatidyltransferase
MLKFGPAFAIERDFSFHFSKANGFWKASDFSARIPDVYTWIESAFLKSVSQSKKNDDIKLHEYCRKGWTFHAKGLWLQSKLSENTHEFPFVNIVGSSNFGCRSTERDLEASFVILTKNLGLKSLFIEVCLCYYGDVSHSLTADFRLGNELSPHFQYVLAHLQLLPSPTHRSCMFYFL